MKVKATLIAATLLLAGLSLGQAKETPTVKVEDAKISITANGHDIRQVMYDLFRQTGQNFVLDTNVRFVLYLNLENVTFQDAFQILLTQGHMGYEIKDGIYFVGPNRGKTKDEPTKPVIPPPLPGPGKPNPKVPPLDPAKEVKGKLSAEDLQKRLTTRLSITDIRKVFAEFTKQTGIKIEVDPAVPQYKIDAFLINTSLKYALDVITDAAHLEYVLTDQKTILVKPKSKA